MVLAPDADGTYFVGSLLFWHWHLLQRGVQLLRACEGRFTCLTHLHFDTPGFLFLFFVCFVFCLLVWVFRFVLLFCLFVSCWVLLSLGYSGFREVLISSDLI